MDICTQVGRHARSVAAVARDYGVGWDTAMGAVEELGRPLVDDPDRIHPVQTLGADETSFRAGKASSHRTSYVTGLVDTQEAFLLDVIEGRDAADLDKWLGVQDQQWLEGVTSVAIDLHEGFRHGLVGHLDHATLVADPFHVVAAANRRVDQVRRRVQNEILGHRGRRDDPLYRIRRILLCAHERLSDSGRKRMDVSLGGGNPKDEVLGAWLRRASTICCGIIDNSVIFNRVFSQSPMCGRDRAVRIQCRIDVCLAVKSSCRGRKKRVISSVSRTVAIPRRS